MSLTSPGYVLFLAACVLLYWLLPERWQRGLLLLASVGFYFYAMPRQFPIMLAYLWLVYALGVGIARRKKRAAKPLLMAGIGVSVGWLFLFKYLDTVLGAFTGGRRALSLVAPMGISYVTFQCIAYLVMVYRKEMRAVANPGLMFLYALFFPKVTAGPIEPPERFFGNIVKKRRLTWRNMLSACVLIGVGFAKKCAAADLIAPAVNAVFQSPGQADGFSTLIAMILYAAQIYFDFSGYTDIALGSARLFDIRLTENFDHPYAAVSVVDFWRRWHISLTAWLRQYVYFPLGGNRVSTARRYLNVLATFLASGLWHGASLTFVVWGLFHGLCQVLEILWGKLFPKKKKPARGARMLGRVRTLALVAVGWVFFRADTLGGAFAVLGGLFNRWALPWEALGALGISWGAWAAFLLTALGADRVKAYAASKRLTGRGGVLCCAALTLLVLTALVLGAGSGAANTFIYFDF
ncbi:MAG: MBOAT family protein [Clostridiales bacterium]|nr:MBOAT family protein [Clostridiales bacterium]